MDHVRYTNPDDGQLIVGVIDAGFGPNGPAVVEHVQYYYGTSDVAFAICTHLDGDHTGGMATVLTELNVEHFLIHRPTKYGHADVSNAERAEELADLAEAEGGKAHEPLQSLGGFGGSLLVGGPSKPFSISMLEEETRTLEASLQKTTSLALAVREAHIPTSTLPPERDFSDSGGDEPGNATSAVVSLMLDGDHMLFPSDTDVAGLNNALNFLRDNRSLERFPRLFVLPHHGSKHNIDLATVHRVLGGHWPSFCGHAVASVSRASSNPSPRVANAAARRGYPVVETRGRNLLLRSKDAPVRDWPTADPLPPLKETDIED